VSSQRFVLGHRLDDGTWRLSRYSLHGLGSLTLPEGFAEELWRQALEQNGEINASKWAALPAAYRITISRPDILKRTASALGCRPFDFALQIPVHTSLGPAYRSGVCRRDGLATTGCHDPRSPCRYRKRCPLARPIRALAPHTDYVAQIPTKPTYDRETGPEVELNWSYSEHKSHLYPQTLAAFARRHLTPDEPRYKASARSRSGHPTGLVEQTPQLLLPHPLTAGPLATGRRQLLIERRASEWVEDEEIEESVLHPSDEDEALKDLVRDVGISQVARHAQVDKRELVRWLVGRKNLGPRRRAKVEQALYSLLTQQAQARAVLRSHPNKSELARRLGADRKTLWRYETGGRPIPPNLVARILTTSLEPRPRRGGAERRQGRRPGRSPQAAVRRRRGRGTAAHSRRTALNPRESGRASGPFQFCGSAWAVRATPSPVRPAPGT